MGYDLHITRKKNWFDDEGPKINWDEWSTYVTNDSDLRFASEYGEGMVLMKVASKYPDPWLSWGDNGVIYTKNPDEPILVKMLEIAKALGAKVQGDDGEVYPSSAPNDWYYQEE